MAIENTYLLGTGITVAGGFDLQAKVPLDSRQTVPLLAGLKALADGNACYEGMIVYVEEDKKTYQYNGNEDWTELKFTDTNTITTTLDWKDITGKPDKFGASVQVDNKTLIFS